MSFTSGALHLLGNVAAPVLKAGASAVDLVTPNNSIVGQGAQMAYNVGASINNPNQVYTGGGFDGSASFRPITAIKGDVTTTPTNNGGNTGLDLTGNGLGGNGVNGSGYTQAQIDAYNRQFLDQIGRLNSRYQNSYNDQTQAQSMLDQPFNDNAMALKSQYDSGMRNLDATAQQNEQNKIKSFRDIGNSIRNSVQAFNSRLGSVGAGDSSAATVAAPYAFAQLNAQQRGQVNDNFNTNQNQINLKRQDVQSEFENQDRALRTEKQQRIQQIAAQYEALRQQIIDQMASADGQRQQILAGANQQAAQNAIANIQALESEYAARGQAIAQAAMANIPQANYATLGSANVNLNPYAQPTTVVPTMGGLANAQDAVSSVPLYRRQDLQAAQYIPPQFLNDNQIQ